MEQATMKDREPLKPQYNRDLLLDGPGSTAYEYTDNELLYDIAQSLRIIAEFVEDVRAVDSYALKV